MLYVFYLVLVVGILISLTLALVSWALLLRAKTRLVNAKRMLKLLAPGIPVEVLATLKRQGWDVDA